MHKRIRHPAEVTGPLLGFSLIALAWALTVLVYLRVSEMEYRALWDHRPHALLSYTRTGDARYHAAYREARQLAAERGWIVPELDVRQITPLFGIWYDRWVRTHGMSMNIGSRELIVDDQHLSLMSDDELLCAMAHEVGHEVDAVYGRERDMRLWPYRAEPCQRFADAVGAMLCGAGRYEAFFRVWIKWRGPETGRCGPDSPVTQ